jgi:hypothetical protein
VASSDIDRDLIHLDADLKRLEAEYNMFFSGRLPRPPWETRQRVEATVKRIDRSPLPNYGDRFRFLTLQTRFATFVELWDRGLRAREEGRPGPFNHGVLPPKAEQEKRPANRILHVAAFHDPLQEMDKLQDLYDSVSEARREVGAENVPFHRFAELVKTQVQKMKAGGSNEVAFRVALKDGKVSFTARALRGAEE